MKNPQNILISGASSGIGKSLAFAYAASGVKLFLCGRNLENLQAVKESCTDLGAEVFIKNFDVENEKDAFAFIEEIESSNAIDLVIANAGISGNKLGDKESFTEIKNIIATNINGTINLIYPVIQKMKQRRKGQVAIVSSLGGFIGIPSSPTYSATKSALRVYAEVLRANLKKDGIAVNVICTGYVETNMTKENKFWMPFLMNPQKAAQIIQKNLQQNKSRIAFPFLPYFAIWLSLFLPRKLIDFFLAKIAKRTTINSL